MTGHTAEVVGIHASPTDPLVATNSWDGTVRLWHTVTGAEIFSAVSSALGFSHDGERLAWTDRDAFGTWRVEFGGILSTLHGHGGKDPRSTAFTRDGRHLVSLGGDGTLLWDVETGARLRWLTRARSESALFPPDGSRLLLTGDEGLVAHRLDNPGDREVVMEDALRDADLTPDGRFAALRLSESDVLLVDFEDRERDRLIRARPGANRVTLSPDGKWLAVGTWKGRGVGIWNTVTGERERTLLRDVGGVRVLFSPDGELLLCGTSRRYLLYRTDTWEEVRRFERPASTSDSGGSGAFTPDGSTLALHLRPFQVSLLDVSTGELLATLEAPGRSAPGRVSFSPDGRYLSAACSDNRIQLWDLEAMWSELERIGL